MFWICEDIIGITICIECYYYISNYVCNHINNLTSLAIIAGESGNTSTLVSINEVLANTFV